MAVTTTILHLILGCVCIVVSILSDYERRVFESYRRDTFRCNVRFSTCCRKRPIEEGILKMGLNPALAPKLETFQQHIDKYIHINMSIKLKRSM